MTKTSRLIIVSIEGHRSYCLFETRKLVLLHKIISPGTKFEIFLGDLPYKLWDLSPGDGFW